MIKRDIHRTYDFFEYVRLEDGSVPPAERNRIDVALLDMNHAWPNLGHDALVHAVIEATEELRPELVRAGLKVRVLSYDVRRKLMLPESPNGRFQLYIGTGGPGHLDPRQNDGIRQWSQGIDEDPAWEAPLFSLFDDIRNHPNAALLAICHSFGLMCRWSGAARAELREEKSSGMPLNALSEDAQSHPWFAQFAQQLSDRRHFRVVDNRLFDLMFEATPDATPIAFEDVGSNGLTMVELARDAHDMPRILGVNHHPEIIDREHIMVVLEEKRAHGEVSDQWYRERVTTMRDTFHGESERQSRVTSHYTLLAPLRHHISNLARSRMDALGLQNSSEPAAATAISAAAMTHAQ